MIKKSSMFLKFTESRGGGMRQAEFVLLTFEHSGEILRSSGGSHRYRHPREGARPNWSGTAEACFRLLKNEKRFF